MSHKDINEHILFPFLISTMALGIISFAFSQVEHRGQPKGNHCINECYEQLKERREVARLAKLEEERLIAAGVIEAPVIVEDLTPPSWNGCAGCHGMNGEGMGMFPKLAGQSKDYIVTALNQYKNKEERGRQSMIMWSQASFLSSRDIDVLGDFISNLEE
tara:strand:- start:238 stop:717 length:480 start_codon:yes stop_codon:yes gene_type:complete